MSVVHIRYVLEGVPEFFGFENSRPEIRDSKNTKKARDVCHGPNKFGVPRGI